MTFKPENYKNDFERGAMAQLHGVTLAEARAIYPALSEYPQADEVERGWKAMKQHVELNRMIGQFNYEKRFED